MSDPVSLNKRDLKQHDKTKQLMEKGNYMFLSNVGKKVEDVDEILQKKIEMKTMLGFSSIDNKYAFSIIQTFYAL